jgi:hypothetical protein
LLREKFGVKFVINMSEKEDFPLGMGKICMKLKPTACLECIAGSTTG